MTEYETLHIETHKPDCTQRPSGPCPCMDGKDNMAEELLLEIIRLKQLVIDVVAENYKLRNQMNINIQERLH